MGQCKISGVHIHEDEHPVGFFYIRPFSRGSIHILDVCRRKDVSMHFEFVILCVLVLSICDALAKVAALPQRPVDRQASNMKLRADV